MENKIFLQVTPFFPSKDDFRGPFVFDQSKAIERVSDFKVKVIKIVSLTSKEVDYNFDGLDVFIFKAFTIPSSILPFLFVRLNVFLLKRLLKKKGLSNIKIINGHVLYTAGILGVELARSLTEAPQSIIQHHGFDIFAETNGVLRGNTLHSYLLKKMGSKYITRATLNVGVSELVLKKLQETVRRKTLKTYVLYNGVDKGKFYEKPRTLKKEVFRIGCIGNFWELKDQITLIKAIGNFDGRIFSDKLKVVFLGTGNLLNTCKKYIIDNKLENYFEFIDFIDHDKLNDFYNELDLFILPSYYEALGCVYLEAYSCGVPFIGVYGQGIEELIPESDKVHHLIGRGDYMQLSSIINEHMSTVYDNKLILNIDVDVNNLISNFLMVLAVLKNDKVR